jgi:hypothetical protein
MFNYIMNCYYSFCETFSTKFETLYRVNKNRLEQENQYYCKMADGGFVIKNSIPKTREERIQVYR